MYELTNIIYLYFIVVICLIAFNFWYICHEKINEKIGNKRKQKYRKIILEEMENTEVSKKRKKYFYHQLKNVNRFLWFDSTLEDLRKESEEIDVDSFLIKLTSVFQKLSVYYRNKDSIQKAYFAHVLSNYPNMSNQTSDRIYQTMLEFTHDDSIYCRENAMIYFYHNGTIDNIVQALRNMNRRKLFYSQKLLTDDLLKFNGDQNVLATSLLEVFDEFCVEMQIAIINFLRLLKQGYEQEVYTRFQTHKYDKEVELAMIRYFARHTYEPMKKACIYELENVDEDNDEYRIVVASTLSSYDEPIVRQTLIKALSDRNWYVRKNAATSLARMQLTKSELNLIEENKDRYAKEMVSYIWKDLGKDFDKGSEKGFADKGFDKGLGKDLPKEKKNQKKGRKKSVSVY